MFGGLKQQSQIKNNLWQNHIVSFQYDATMRRCWVTAEANDGCFDAANANKSCVRVHGGQSSELRSNAPVITAKTGEHDHTGSA